MGSSPSLGPFSANGLGSRPDSSTIWAKTQKSVDLCRAELRLFFGWATKIGSLPGPLAYSVRPSCGLILCTCDRLPPSVSQRRRPGCTQRSLRRHPRRITLRCPAQPPAGRDCLHGLSHGHLFDPGPRERRSTHHPQCWWRGHRRHNSIGLSVAALPRHPRDHPAPPHRLRALQPRRKRVPGRTARRAWCSSDLDPRGIHGSVRGHPAIDPPVGTLTLRQTHRGDSGVRLQRGHWPARPGAIDSRPANYRFLRRISRPSAAPVSTTSTSLARWSLTSGSSPN